VRVDLVVDETKLKYKQLVVQQSVEQKISARTTAFIQAFVVTRSGVGLGSVAFGTKTTFSDVTSGEASLTFNTAAPFPSLSLGARRVLSADAKGAMFFTYRHDGHGLKLQCSRNLGRGFEGILACGLGIESGVNARVVRAFTSSFSEEGKMLDRKVELGYSLGPRNASIDGSYSHHFTRFTVGEFSLSLDLVSGLVAKVNSRQTLENHSVVKAGVSAGARGVTLKLGYARGGVSIALPILLASSFRLGPAVAAAVVPPMAQYVIKSINDPLRRKRRRLEFIARLKSLASARARSKAQLALLAPGARKQRKVEEGEDGLVILNARYGMRLGELCSWSDDVKEPLWEDARSLSHPPNIDVTDQLMFLVKGGKLNLRAASKSSLLGCYNPCPSLPFSGAATGFPPCHLGPPKLFVRYRFSGFIFEIQVDDDESVCIPESPKAKLIGSVGLTSAVYE